jgi:glutathione S-transferase
MSDLLLTVDRFWISPYAFSAWVALREKDLEFTVQEIGLDKKEHKVPEYRSQTLTARVPALRHGDFWLAESSAIVEYLEDVFPAKKVLPTDVQDKARARQIMAWIRSDLMPIREERPTTSIFYEPAKKPLSDGGKAAAEKLIEVASSLLAHDRPNIFSTFTIADADLALMLMRLHKNQHPLPARLSKFAESVWSRPSVKAFVDTKRAPYVDY